MSTLVTTRVGSVAVRDAAETIVLSDGSDGVTYDEMGRLEHRASIAVLRRWPVDPSALKFARKTLGLRQVELAEQLGVTTETVCRWERGKEPFRRIVALAMMALLIESHGTPDTSTVEFL